jgi:hypothetical protein
MISQTQLKALSGSNYGFLTLMERHKEIGDAKVQEAMRKAWLTVELGRRTLMAYLERTHGKGKCKGACCSARSVDPNW